MLMRQTILYLPAQVIGPLSQMAATIVWTYWLQPDALGTYALIWSIQEFVGLAALAWWTSYVLRYATSLRAEFGTRRLDDMDGTVQFAAALTQTLLSLVAIALVLDVPVTLNLAASTVAFTLSRTLIAHFSDRGRALGQIGPYTILQIVGSLLGFLAGLAAMAFWSRTTEALLWSYAGAQTLALVWALARMHFRPTRLTIDMPIFRGAWVYGAPLFIASLLVWVSNQAIRFVVEADLGLAAVGYVTVGWWLGMRLTTFVSLLVTGPSFSIAVEAIRKYGHRGALPQFAANGALLLAVLVPAVAGIVVLNGPMVRLLVDPTYVDATLGILPYAVAAGAIRAFKNHGSDQCFVLFERTTVNVWSTVVEATSTVIGCWIGLKLNGMVGAVQGCFVAAIFGEAFSFFMASRLFGYYLRLDDLARIGCATATMVAALVFIPTPHGLAGMFGMILLGVIVYVAAMAILYPDISRPIRRRATRLVFERSGKT